MLVGPEVDDPVPAPRGRERLRPLGRSGTHVRVDGAEPGLEDQHGLVGERAARIEPADGRPSAGQPAARRLDLPPHLFGRERERARRPARARDDGAAGVFEGRNRRDALLGSGPDVRAEQGDHGGLADGAELRADGAPTAGRRACR